MKWLVLAGAILLEVTATMSLKGAMELPWLYAVVVAGYVGSFTCLGIVLRMGMELGVAYGIWGACGVALTAVLSMLIFREPLTPVMGIGIVLIILGVLCIELGSQAARRKAEAA